MALEHRVITTTPELRVEESEGKGPVISGYAATFWDEEDRGTEFSLWGGAVERIMPGAFDRALTAGQDARALYNHDPNLVLGRVSNGSLSLTTDDTGLRYEITPPDTQTARDVRELIRTGAVTGSSFGFIVTREEWIHPEAGEEGPSIREIHSVDLHDVGPVTFPAYEASTAEARSAFDASLESGAARSPSGESRAKLRSRVSMAMDLVERDLPIGD